MTAQEARELTTKKKKDIKDLEYSIWAMAENGLSYSVHKVETIKQPEVAKAYFEKLGYKVTLGETYLGIY